MSSLRVRDLMTPDVEVVDRNDALAVPDELMRERRLRHVVVVEDGEVVGVVSQRDLFRTALARLLGYGGHAQDKLLAQLAVKEVMTNDPVTIGPDAPAVEAAALLLDRKIGCLPVVEGRRLVGIVTESDFVRKFSENG